MSTEAGRDQFRHGKKQRRALLHLFTMKDKICNVRGPSEKMTRKQKDIFMHKIPANASMYLFLGSSVLHQQES